MVAMILLRTLYRDATVLTIILINMTRDHSKMVLTIVLILATIVLIIVLINISGPLTPPAHDITKYTILDHTILLYHMISCNII